MKRLYNCNATHDEVGKAKRLCSYNTRIAFQLVNLYGLWYYPSSTSKQHLRKYIKYLREIGENKSANIFQDLYNFCRDNGHAACCYDSITGKKWTADNLHDAFLLANPV